MVVLVWAVGFDATANEDAERFGGRSVNQADEQGGDEYEEDSFHTKHFQMQSGKPCF